MRPILWRHWLTGGVLFAGAWLLTLAPSAGVVAMAFMPPEEPLPVLADEVDDRWQPLSVAPIAIPAVGEAEPVVAAEGSAPAVGDAPKGTAPKVVAPAKTPARTARAAAREARTGDEPRVAAARKAKPDTKCLDPDPRIREVSPGRYEVDRALAESLTDLSELSKQGYAAPHADESGKADGFRIGGLRCGNYLHQAGFRRGDVVQAVNGKPTRNALQAWAAYLSERDSDVLRVEIERKGVRQTLVYRLV